MPPIRRSEIDLSLQAFAVFSMSGSFQVTFFFEPRSSVRFSPSCGELCGNMPLDGLHCSPFATCGVENPRYYDGGQCISAVASPENAHIA